MSNIAHVYKDYYPILGGIENHIKTLAEAQAAAGHDVTVLVTNPGGQLAREVINGVKLIRAWRVATVASTPLSPSLPFLLAGLKPDVTHLHFPYPIGELSQLLVGNGWGKSRFTVLGYHSDVVKQQQILRLYRPFLNRILQKVDAIFVGSRQYIDSSEWLRPLSEKCVLSPYAVAPQDFENAVPLIEATDVPTLLFMGQHRYYKGVDNLIRAMVNLNARLLIGGDGLMRSEWEQLTRELNVAHKIQFVGRVSDADLARLYASADVFVLPSNSRAESFGKVLLEAMATGLPCITTEIGTGTSFVVQDGVTGLVVPPRDVGELVTAVNHLLQNPDLRRQMGAAGRARVKQIFTPEKMVARVEAVYKSG